MGDNYNNYDFLKKYQNLQYTVMFDELVELNSATVGFSRTDKSSYWNLALVNGLLTIPEIEEVEGILSKAGRKPTFYFESRRGFGPLIQVLEARGYKKSFEDSWQFWEDGKIDESHFGLVKKVASEGLLEEFLETLNECYRAGDPQNPYGELGEYLRVAEIVWRKHNKSGRLEYFIVYEDAKPVAVSTLTNFEGVGYISNVGSLREVRGEGFGKLATLFCVAQSIKNRNQEHCLATEEGAYPNEFYKRIGFETRFTATGYTKQD